MQVAQFPVRYVTTACHLQMEIAIEKRRGGDQMDIEPEQSVYIAVNFCESTSACLHQ